MTALEFAQDWAPGSPPFSGAGDNAFTALLVGNAGGPVVFHDRFEQTALVRLKVAALRMLPVQSVRSFFGLGHFGRRIWFYHELRASLDPRVRLFWDEREPSIREGLLQSGRYEQALARFRTRFLPLVQSQESIDALFACRTPSEQQAFVAEVWRSRRWSILRRAHPLAAAIDRELDLPVAGNFRLQWRLLGCYPDLEAGPPWLTTAGHAGLRKSLDRLEITEPRA